MQQSNGYVIGFAVALSIVLGGILAFTAVSLKERQAFEQALDTKKQILNSVMDVQGQEKRKLAEIYDSRIKSIVVDVNGSEVSTEDYSTKPDAKPEDVIVVKEWKKLKKEGEAFLPVFKWMKEGSEEVEAYIFPMYGSGLWNDIWGYVAINADLKTIRGISFDHKGETPGLGARITDAEIQVRYKGKSILANGKISPVVMLKGEGAGNDPKITEHTVDGMSGATLTANGVNEMVDRYLNVYGPYMTKERGTAAVSLAN